MRQVTGSNPNQSNNKVSIQLKLDGHSFSHDILPCNIDKAAVIEIELLTEKSILVPSECFEPKLALQYLRFSGFECSKEECAVWSREADGTIAVMLLHQDVAKRIEQLYGDAAVFTSPMLRQVESNSQQYLCIYNATDFAYFKLYDGKKLLFCEVFTIAGNDDILCFTEKIAQEFKLTAFTIQLAGENTPELSTLLKQYYKIEKCE